jgi:hypothetical protein
VALIRELNLPGHVCRQVPGAASGNQGCIGGKALADLWYLTVRPGAPVSEGYHPGAESRESESNMYFGE